jgi:hypothetical protein
MFSSLVFEWSIGHEGAGGGKCRQRLHKCALTYYFGWEIKDADSR